jgi:hypothetical protein
MFRRVSDKPQGGARRECQASRREPVLLMDEIESDRLLYAMSALLVFFALAATVFLSYY